MSKRNVARETGVNFLIGYGIGRVGRMVYDQNKAKKQQLELEKREAYRQAYGEEAYREKYEPKFEQLVQPVNHEKRYKELAYRVEKKNPFIALVLSIFTIVFGYLYISPVYFLVAFLANGLMFNVIDTVSSRLPSTEYKVFAQMGGIVALYFLNVILTFVLVFVYNANVKRKIERGE